MAARQCSRGTGFSLELVQCRLEARWHHVGNDIFLAYEGVPARTDLPQTFIAEYKLPRGYVVELELERPSNNSRVGIKYDWNF